MTNYSYHSTQPQFIPEKVDKIIASLGVIWQEDPRLHLVARQVEFDPGEIVDPIPGQMEPSMYILMQGHINLICKGSTSRRLVTSTLGPGSIWLQEKLCEQNIHQPVAHAMDDVSIWAIPIHEAHDLIIRHPMLSWVLLETYAQRLLQVEDRLEDIVCKNLPERIAGLLLELGNYKEGRIEGYSHQMLADYLGTYRETISSILRQFKHEQLIDLGYRWINLKDKDRLYEKAGLWESMR